MEIKSFIEKFADLFEETSADIFTEETNFKDLDEWSSLLALSLIAMADDEYGVRLRGEDINNTKTLKDLSSLIQSKL